MKISRNSLAFMSVLAAGLLLATATFVLPSAKTYGSETDVTNQKIADGIARELAAAQNQKPPAAPQGSTAPSQAPAAQAPAPPAAPLDNAPAAAGSDNAGAANSPVALPSTGSGGYLNQPATTSMGYILVGIGLALMGSGSLVWAVSRKRR
jgi:uncharacterized membrane protein